MVRETLFFPAFSPDLFFSPVSLAPPTGLPGGVRGRPVRLLLLPRRRSRAEQPPRQLGGEERPLPPAAAAAAS